MSVFSSIVAGLALGRLVTQGEILYPLKSSLAFLMSSSHCGLYYYNVLQRVGYTDIRSGNQHDKQNSKAVVRAFALIYNYRDDFAKVAELRL